MRLIRFFKKLRYQLLGKARGAEIPFGTSERAAAPKQPAMRNEGGERLDGRYELRGRLGDGCSSMVWLARERRTGVDFACKLAQRQPQHKWGQLVRTYEHEANLLCDVLGPHPRLVTCYGLYRSTSAVGLILSYAPGGDCQQLLQRHGALSEQAVLGVGTQLAEALDYLHSHGVLHRDVKPENLLVTSLAGDSPSVRLCDFGHSAKVELRQDHFRGTEVYAAPEVRRAPPPQPSSPPVWSAASDVWSAGAVLAVMAANAPFDDAQLARLRVGSALKLLLLQMVSPAPEQRPDVARAYENLVQLAEESQRRREMASLHSLSGGDSFGRRGLGAHSYSMQGGIASLEGRAREAPVERRMAKCPSNRSATDLSAGFATPPTPATPGGVTPTLGGVTPTRGGVTPSAGATPDGAITPTAGIPNGMLNGMLSGAPNGAPVPTTTPASSAGNTPLGRRRCSLPGSQESAEALEHLEELLKSGADLRGSDTDSDMETDTRGEGGAQVSDAGLRDSRAASEPKMDDARMTAQKVDPFASADGFGRGYAGAIRRRDSMKRRASVASVGAESALDFSQSLRLDPSEREEGAARLSRPPAAPRADKVSPAPSEETLDFAQSIRESVRESIRESALSPSWRKHGGRWSIEEGHEVDLPPSSAVLTTPAGPKHATKLANGVPETGYLPSNGYPGYSPGKHETKHETKLANGVPAIGYPPSKCSPSNGRLANGHASNGHASNGLHASSFRMEESPTSAKALDDDSMHNGSNYEGSSAAADREVASLLEVDFPSAGERAAASASAAALGSLDSEGEAVAHSFRLLKTSRWPWRGTYPRELRLCQRTFCTCEPFTKRVTNSWRYDEVWAVIEGSFPGSFALLVGSQLCGAVVEKLEFTVDAPNAATRASELVRFRETLAEVRAGRTLPPEASLEAAAKEALAHEALAQKAQSDSRAAPARAHALPPPSVGRPPMPSVAQPVNRPQPVNRQPISRLKPSHSMVSLYSMSPPDTLNARPSHAGATKARLSQQEHLKRMQETMRLWRAPRGG